jgi:hypothetical protein
MNNYESFRHKIKSGDVVAFDREGVVTLFTTSQYSHVGLVWRVSGRLFVLEAVHPYVRIVPLSNFATEGFYVLSMKQALSKEETEFALSLVGTAKYSYMDGVKAYLKKLKIGEDKAFQCAEYVISARRLSGVDLGDVATPEAIVQKALESGYEINYVKG